MKRDWFDLRVNDGQDGCFEHFLRVAPAYALRPGMNTLHIPYEGDVDLSEILKTPLPELEKKYKSVVWHNGFDIERQDAVKGIRLHTRGIDCD